MLFAVNATAETKSGTCGANITWKYNEENFTLTLTGSGAMTNFTDKDGAPWRTITAKLGTRDFFISSLVENVEIEGNITNIGDYAFDECNYLRTLNVQNPDLISSIGTRAFNNCYVLKIEQTFENATIGDYAFAGCTDMQDEYGVIYLGKYLVEAKTGCEENVVIKRGTTAILSGAFIGTGVKTIQFQDETLTSIGDKAFYGCSNLTTLNIPNTVTTWGENIFSGCTNLPNDGTYQKAGDHVIVKVVATGKSDYTIPGNIIYIAENAFIGCTEAQNIFSEHSYGKMPKAASTAFDFDGFEPNYYVADGNEEACKTNWKATEAKINHTQITVGKTGYATVTILHHSAKVPEGIEAYTAKVEGDQVKLSKVSELAKGEGYILIGNTDTHDFGPAKKEVSKPNNNSMVGVTYDTEVSGDEYYVLCPADNGGVEFLCVGSETARITAGKSYLYVPNSPARLSIYNDNNETGIEETSEYYNTQNNNSIYNLAGQKLTQPKKGLNVINGKLVLM